MPPPWYGEALGIIIMLIAVMLAAGYVLQSLILA
jgi:hypothetical protein